MSNLTSADITAIQSAIQGYAAGLLGYVNSLASYIPTFAYNLPSLPAPTLTNVTPIDIPTLTSLGPLTGTTASNPNNNPYEPLQADALPQYQQASMDTTTAAAFIAQFEALSPTLLAAVETEILQILNSGGQNVGPTISNAIFNTGYERNLQTLNDAMDLAGARAGAKGNRYTNSMLKAAQMQVMTTYQYGQDDLSRKIVEVMANFAQANLRDAINAGVRIDELQVQIFTTSAGVLTRIQELILDEYKTNVLTNYQVFEAALRLQMTDLEVQKADRDEMRAFIGQVRDQIALTSRVTVTEFEVGSKLQVLQAEVNKFVDDLTIKQNEQAISLFAELVKQLTTQQQLTLNEIDANNKIQLASIQGAVSGFGELVKSLSAQSVSISTTNTPS
jgi:hypothetical protein